MLTEFSQGENEKVTALRNALSVPFYELERYSSYVTDNTRFATHQGVKGLEFPRVMVIMDDAQARGFLFSYEKLFGAKAQSDTDVKKDVYKRQGNGLSALRQRLEQEGASLKVLYDNSVSLIVDIPFDLDEPQKGGRT